MNVQIVVSENAGACYGVDRALQMTFDAAKDPGPVHTLGPLIHNPRVVESLETQGVGVIESIDQVDHGTVVLRSHGTDPKIIDEAIEKGLDVVDATCPYVSKVQRKARELADSGYSVIIIGEPGHAEVEGIRAWGKDAVICVVEDPSMIPEDLPPKVGVVIQTTQSEDRVRAVVDALQGKVGDLRVEKTVCLATQQRQSAAKELSKRSDLMIVIGGRNSGNTRRLHEICSANCERAHHIEDASEIDPAWLEGVSAIGVTAGASTPQSHIDSVVARLEEIVDGRVSDVAGKRV